MNHALALSATIALAVMTIGARLSGSFVARTRSTFAPRRHRSVGSVRQHREAGPTRHAPTDLQIASWCEYAARALRSGHSITTALDRATVDEPSMREVMTPVLSAVSRGRPLTDALGVLVTPRARRNARQRTGASIAMVTAVLGTCADLGGPAAAPLDRVAGILRMRAALADEQRVQSAQARLSARVLTVVPVAILVVLLAADSTVRATLATPLGLIVVVAGCVLNGCGWWWMRHIIGSAA